MHLQIAFNSNNLDFALSETENSRTNNTNLFASIEKTRGKFMLLSMKVNTQKNRIFKKVQNDDKFMNGYEFKYFNGKEESELYDYKIFDSPDISYTESID